MSDQVIIGHYILGRTIGSGGFARVKSTYNNNFSGKTQSYKHRSRRKDHQ